MEGKMVIVVLYSHRVVYVCSVSRSEGKEECVHAV